MDTHGGGTVDQFNLDGTQDDGERPVLDLVPLTALALREPSSDGATLETLATVPTDESFGGGDYQAAPDVQAMAEHLIATNPHFTFLRGERIEYLWKRKGGAKNGRITLGTCGTTPSLAKFYSSTDFTIWLGADNCRDMKITEYQFEALVSHELMHLAPKEDTGDAKIIGHDFEGFQREIAIYGFWQPTFEQMAVAVQQRFVFDTQAEA